MSKIWLTSDQHFWHTNVIKYCDRPYIDVVSMNEDLIARYNAVVKPEDTVYHLGDFCMAFRPVELYAYRLNGTKYLIPGNHDFCSPAHKKSNTPEKRALWEQKYIDAGFAEVLPLNHYLDIPDGPRVLLSHMPYRNQEPGGHGEKHAEWRPIDKGEWLLHGHIHQLWQVKGRMINVGVDVWNYAPVSLDSIRELIKKGPQ